CCVPPPAPPRLSPLSLHDALPILIGCGAQSGAQLRAVAAVRTLRRVLVSDMDNARAERFAEEQGKALGIAIEVAKDLPAALAVRDRKSTRLNSSHVAISYAVFCLK